jgi:molybdopterin synthase sulfur carrier subunit
MKVLYFAWLRERIGFGEEEISPPAGVSTVGELMAWLAARDETFAYAFENPKLIRAAVDQMHVKPTAPISGAAEIAFFPPMTGG